jgi:ribosomal protein S12 methylthiotransferase accessory factor
MTQTFIKGKDRDLESSIKSMQRKLQNIGIEIEEVSWLNPVANVYSVHIRDKHCHLMFTNGKGSTKKACLASALGEYFERLSCNYFWADFYLGDKIANATFVHYPNEKWFEVTDNQIPQGILDTQLWKFYNPENNLEAKHCYDLNSGNGERGICTLPYTRQSDQQTIYFPVNIIGNCYVSNGMSAGNTKNEARVQSLSEIFERYIKNKIIAEGICLPKIPTTVLQRYPKILASINELKEHGYQLRVADASLGGLYPVISVTLINPKNATVFASFGAHPSFEVALERTVTELLQGRSLEQLNGFLSPSLDLDEVADQHNLETHFIDSSGLIAYDFFKDNYDYNFIDWDFSGTTEDEFNHLTQQIHKMGFDVYIADFEHLSVYSCRILVPGMSDIYPAEDLYWNNSNEGALFRKDCLNLNNLSQSQIEALYQRFQEGGYHDFQTVAEFIGIAPEPNSKWASLRIGELKAMLCLASQNPEALEWIEWCLNSDQLNSQDRLSYQCMQSLISLSATQPYLNSLHQLFSKTTVETCQAIIAGTTTFDGLNDATLALNDLATHQRLLAAYEKLQKVK